MNNQRFSCRSLLSGSSTVVVFILVCGCTAIISTTQELPQLLLAGDVVHLHKRDDDAPQNSPDRPRLLIVALDGMNRDLLYEILRAGELPGFAKLLGGQSDGDFPHAYFNDRLTAALPSSTAAAWVTAMTGAPPAEHGVVGNEFFVRETRRFETPIPISLSTRAPVIRAYTEGYWNSLVQVPGVYEQMRERDPDIQIWVTMHQYQAGADKLILSEGTVLADAFEALLAIGAAQLVETAVELDDTSALSREVDQKAIEATVGQFKNGTNPDVLTVYIAGTDHTAHVGSNGPDKARRDYLINHLDPLFKYLYEALQEYGFWDNRYVVLTSDHGNIEVKYDDRHALGTDGDDEPAELLRLAGFRPRPFTLEVADNHDFNTVLAYQGAIAYVYVADRSTCHKKGMVCDWSVSPRYQDDVLALAEAIWLNNENGNLVPELKGALDMVLVRKPGPFTKVGTPFEVYVGGGRTMSLTEYLSAHPGHDYIDFEARLRDLTVGRYGERTGNLLLVARNSLTIPLDERYYFGPNYYSWHGSPTEGDSEIPLIVAHPDLDTDTLRKKVENGLGERAAHQRFTNVLLELRYGDEARAGR